VERMIAQCGKKTRVLQSVGVAAGLVMMAAGLADILYSRSSKSEAAPVPEGPPGW